MPRFKGDTSISSSRKRVRKKSQELLQTLTDGDTLRIDEIGESVLNEFRQMVRQMLMADVVQVVIIGILGHTAIEVRPREDILSQANKTSFIRERRELTIASCLFSIVFTAISARK